MIWVGVNNLLLPILEREKKKQEERQNEANKLIK